MDYYLKKELKEIKHGDNITFIVFLILWAIAFASFLYAVDRIDRQKQEIIELLQNQKI